MNFRYGARALKSLPARLVQIIRYLFALRWLRDPLDLVEERRAASRRFKRYKDTRRGQISSCSPCEGIVSRDIYKRPDPMIYSQHYLMEQGLAVTWNNPDIQLFQAGIPVPSNALTPGSEYEVVATIYNNSTDAPAVGLPVEFSFQSFGVGANLVPIGTTTVNLPVKGAPGHPPSAAVTWRTPDEPGHYCIRVRLVWNDDANPKNNLGQENTDVVLATSPATYRFPVRNDDVIRKVIRMTADAYSIPPPLDCGEIPSPQDSDRRYPQFRRQHQLVPVTEEDADWTLARARHAATAFPIPPGWSIEIDPGEMTLEPGLIQEVTVTVEPPAGFTGEHSFNVNAMHGSGLLGGVTLTVRQQ